MRARVRFFDVRKGWGFATDENEKDYFLHFRNIEGEGFKTLNPGDEITFDEAMDVKRHRVFATNIKRVST